MQMLPEPNDIRETLRRFREAETLIRAIDPWFLANAPRIADEGRNTLTALGYIRVGRAVTKPRAVGMTTHTPQKRASGRPSGKYYLPVEKFFRALNTFLDKHGKPPTYQQLADATNVSEDTIKRTINDRCAPHFKGRDGFRQYCAERISRQ